MKACQEGVVDGWAKLATSKDRLAALVALVNKKLVAAGVPPREGRLRHEPGEPRQLDFTTWTMLVGQGPLGRESLSEAEAKDLADTVYHEARHTEQWFNMAQLRAGQGLSAKALVTELDIPADIATKARAPLVRGSMKLLIAQGWWDSVYGTGSAHREKVLTEVDKASTALRAARDKEQADPSEENKAAATAALARFQKAFAAYQNLPEENDAWATGPFAAEGVTSGTPESEKPSPGGAAPAGPTIDEPAGVPPSTNGPAHEVLPEKDLPA